MCRVAAMSAAARERKKVRPLPTPEARTKHIATLRTAYAKPPSAWPAPKVDPDVAWKELGLLAPPSFPADNPYSQAKADLGKLLFFDPRLSSSRQIACASCHDPDLAWADGRTTAYGHERQPLARNTPSLATAAFSRHWFWDGRAETLEDQAKAVILNAAEMHASESAVLANLSGLPEYGRRFREAFGSEQITLDAVAKALATFERTLPVGYSRFDAFLRGQSKALSDSALAGLHLFRTDARCMNCHHGPSFTDNQFHEVGLSYYGRELEDLGRYSATGSAADVGRFKTPSLRNVSRTAPYMHNGLFQLEGVLNMYNAGMPFNKRKSSPSGAPPPTKSNHLQPLHLNAQDLADLKAFLVALAEPLRRVRAPALPAAAVSLAK